MTERNYRRGEEHGNSRLDADQVRQIREDAAAHFPLRQLALRHYVSHTTIQAIVKRRTWRHVE
jgi:hypothetical protein